MVFNGVSVTWLVLLVVFLVGEGITAGLVSMWFAAGALAALVCQLVGLPVWLQIVVFFVVSVVTLLLMRPIAAGLLRKDKQPTNADRVFSQVGVVTAAIDNVAGTGLVKLESREWTARSFTGTPIPAGTLVQPKMIEGVKLIVCPVEHTGEAPALQDSSSKNSVF